MKRLVALLTADCLAVAVALAFAQPPAQAPTKTTLSVGLQRGYENIKRNLTQAAEKMPETDYGFQPNPKMPEVRTYGQLFGHVANAQFGACAVAKGVPNPNQGTDNEKKTTKAELVKALADSFAFCDDAFKSLTDESALQLVKQGQNEVARGLVLSNLVTHSNEMYGTTGVYMRLKGMVPPSTEGRGMRGRGAL
ncbi:MAG: DinB family protein [Acidobacteria bacterium]|nr:DinB family protein [Acidobacteriota bacterium]